MGAEVTGLILAGGKSLRFGGNASRPKPVVEIHGVALVLRAAAKLVDAGASRICVLTGRNHQAIRDALGMTRDAGFLMMGAGRAIPFELRFSGNEAGSAGRLLAVDRAEFAEGALLSYTDVFTDAAVSGLLDLIRDQRSALGLMTVSPPLPWGVVQSCDSLVTGFHEKPRIPALRANAGFYACTSRILEYISTPNEMLEAEPMARMIEAGVVRAWHHEGEWLGIDNFKDVANAEAGYGGLFDGHRKLVVSAEDVAGTQV